MAIITDANRQKVQQLFDRDLQDPLQILVFYVDTEGDEFTGATRQLVGELAALSGGRLTVRELELQASPDDARTYGIDRVPALVFLDRDGRDQGFRFLGAPVGYEFTALLEDIVDVSRRTTRLTAAVKAKIQSIQQELLIQVFSTPTWPHCPQAVRLAHMAAMENPRIRAHMVDAMEFQDLAQHYQVSGVPLTVIDGARNVTFVGKYPESRFVDELLKAL